MAALNFPNSPSLNDTHTENGVTFKWNGAAWDRLGDIGAQGAAGAQGSAGAAGAQGATGPVAGSSTQVVYKDGSNNPAGSANLTFDGTNLSVGGNVSIGGTLTYEDVTNIDSVGIITARQGIDTDTVRGKTNNSNLAIGARASNGAFVQTITIKPDRSVGLGNITNPTSILDVRQTNTGAATEIKLFNLDQSNATTQTAALVMTPDVRANGVKIVAVKEVADMSSSANKDLALTFQTVANNSAAEKLRVTSEGKVLIGSDTGSVHGNRLLQIGKTNRAETYVSIVSSTSGESGLLFADTTTNDTGGYRGQIRYHHSDDSMNFRTGAAERLRITSGGYVGINQSTPAQPLHIHAPSTSLAAIRLSGTASSQVEYDIRQGIVNVSNGGFSIRDITNSATRFAITSAGEVNLYYGTINLGTADSSSGHINAYELMTFNIDSDNDDSNRHFTWYKNGASGGGTAMMRLNEDGRLGIGGDLATSANNITLKHATAVEIDMNCTSGSGNNFRLKSDSGGIFTIRDHSAGNDRLTIRDNGSVGINKTDPGQRLHVTGSMAMDNTNGLLFFAKDGEGVSTNSNNTHWIGRVDTAGYHATSGAGGFNSVAGSLAIGAKGPIMFATSANNDTYSTGRAIITSDGNMGLGLIPSYSGVFGGSQRVLHIGGTTAPGLRIQSSTTNQGDFIIQAGNSGGATYLSNLSNNADTVFYNTSGGSAGERLRIHSGGLVTTPNQVSFLQRDMNGADFNGGTLKGGSPDHNIGGHYNTSTGIFTAPVAGVYMFGCGVLVNSGSGRLEGNISKNNSYTIVNFNGTGNTYDGATATCVVSLAASDNVRVKRQSGTAYGQSHGNHYFWGRLMG